MTGVLTWRRFLGIGFGAGVGVLVLGMVAERAFVGWSDADARRRALERVSARVAHVDTALTKVARDLAGRSEVIAGMTGDLPAVRQLFDLLRDEGEGHVIGGLAITVYDARSVPRAWYGRPAELPRNLIETQPVGFAESGPVGLRLVHVEPVVESTIDRESTSRRLGAVVVERVLWSANAATEATPGTWAKTPAGRVLVRATGERDPGLVGSTRQVVAGLDGQARIVAIITDDEIARVRERWRATALALAFMVTSALTLVGGMVLARRYTHALNALGLVPAMLMLGAGLLWLAVSPRLAGDGASWMQVYQSVRLGWLIRTPLDLLLVAVVGMVVAVGLVGGGYRWRRWARLRGGATRNAPLGALAAVVLVAIVLAAQQWLLRDTVAGARVELSVTALQPFDLARTMIQLALLLLSTASVWVVTAVVMASLARWSPSQRGTWLGPMLLFSLLPAGIVSWGGWAPAGPALLTSGFGVLLAVRWRRARSWFRHSDRLAGGLAILCTFLFPALPLYLTLVELTEAAKRELVAARYAVQAAEHPQDLQRQLGRTLEQIDTMPGLGPLITGPFDVSGPLDSDRAFSIWRQTALAASRLTSAVELYGADGTLHSRFALDIPEYAVNTSQWVATGCAWEVFGEVTPVGSEERRMLHAERALCESDGAGTTLGTVVVHVAQVDYDSLSFIGSRSPYADLFVAADESPVRGSPGHAVELVVYGWGRQPAFLSGDTAWTIDDRLFQRIYASRTPFWTRLTKGSREYEVFFTNNRAGIYALGYPVHTIFDHVLHLSELAILVIEAFAGVLALVLLIGLVLPGRRSQRAYREIRARFALRLQLWFVGVATVPIVVVAVLSQRYFADQIRADVEAGAARTAAVARSVIEESTASSPSVEPLNVSISDDVLVRISQVVGQDLNLFNGSRLVATSERDLYASGFLPTRTPDRVYRAIALDQLPGFVTEDVIGALGFQLAAAPVRVGSQDLILTVPLASRQQEIESQIDELTRRVSGSALFFAAVVGVLGWAIARSIANPVKRLTRATSRIARGEFSGSVSTQHADLLEKRVAARSADELAVLELDFNRMAVELDVQRRELERTHRLEAWTEMARQVAHEIKNPLTPVQLNAEHLLRVHRDRGEPLSPILQECVDSILKQVRILRQIASEFSSYASSPAADLVPTPLDALILEVVAPYRPGLVDRIDFVVEVPSSLLPLHLDRVLMQRALTNIIENALHAMPDVGRLSIGVGSRGGHLDLVISDTGVGLEPDVLARIFEPYFSTRVTGTGLGMAIAKRNVELNGGKIRVDSEPGRGTRVTISLPSEAETPPTVSTA